MKYSSDKETISNEWDDLSVRFHYNFIENAIISELKSCRKVLDIGPGYGHWIKFYKDVYHPVINFIEIDYDVFQDIVDRFHVSGMIGSIADSMFVRQFDVINAIGVLHHVMKDRDLVEAIYHITTMLRPSGTLFIGTRVDFIKSPRERNRKFRTLQQWKDLLKDYDVTIQRSDPPWHCRKHLDLIIAHLKK